MIKLQINGDPVQIVPCSVSQALAERGLGNKRVAVERNGSIVPRSQHAHTMLEEGDVLEIVIAVGGG